MVHVFGFVEFYLAPFIFAVGLVLFLYGVINYFIIGPGYDEERREMGRQLLLWTLFLFLLGLILYLVASWLFDLSQKIDERVDVESERSVNILSVPNAPGVQ